MAERIYLHSKDQETEKVVHKINQKVKLSAFEKRKILNEKSKEQMLLRKTKTIKKVKKHDEMKERPQSYKNPNFRSTLEIEK